MKYPLPTGNYSLSLPKGRFFIQGSSIIFYSSGASATRNALFPLLAAILVWYSRTHATVADDRIGVSNIGVLSPLWSWILIFLPVIILIALLAWANYTEMAQSMAGIKFFLAYTLIEGIGITVLMGLMALGLYMVMVPEGIRDVVWHNLLFFAFQFANVINGVFYASVQFLAAQQPSAKANLKGSFTAAYLISAILEAGVTFYLMLSLYNPDMLALISTLASVSP